MDQPKGHTAMRFISMMVMVTGISICATGCTKKDDAGTATTTATTASAAPASGCGADYADPKKEFCMKLPDGFEPTVDKDPGTLYVEIVKFDAPMDHFDVSVGFSSSNFTSYDEQLASDEKWMGESKTLKIESSGKTAADGKWWLYTDQGYTEVGSETKSNGNNVIHCQSNDRKPGIIDACKSIRAYPK
ncbi:hypothetical protein BH09MYX1_BH09MYX1_30840 [soil metagenome]